MQGSGIFHPRIFTFQHRRIQRVHILFLTEQQQAGGYDRQKTKHLGFGIPFRFLFRHHGYPIFKLIVIQRIDIYPNSIFQYPARQVLLSGRKPYQQHRIPSRIHPFFQHPAVGLEFMHRLQLPPQQIIKWIEPLQASRHIRQQQIPGMPGTDMRHLVPKHHGHGLTPGQVLRQYHITPCREGLPGLGRNSQNHAARQIPLLRPEQDSPHLPDCRQTPQKEPCHPEPVHAPQRNGTPRGSIRHSRLNSIRIRQDCLQDRHNRQSHFHPMPEDPEWKHERKHESAQQHSPVETAETFPA